MWQFFLLHFFLCKLKGELTMDVKELKKVLAGIGVVGLLAGGGISVPGSAGASGWGGEKPSAVSADEHAAGSGWGGEKGDAGSVTDDVVDGAAGMAKEKVGLGGVADGHIDDAADKVKKKLKKEEPAGSGWSGSKDGAGSADEHKAKPASSGWSGW